MVSPEEKSEGETLEWNGLEESQLTLRLLCANLSLRHMQISLKR
jgi:hypothetical protein